MTVRRIRFVDIAYLIGAVILGASFVGLNILNYGFTMG